MLKQQTVHMLKPRGIEIAHRVQLQLRCYATVVRTRRAGDANRGRPYTITFCFGVRIDRLLQERRPWSWDTAAASKLHSTLL